MFRMHFFIYSSFPIIAVVLDLIYVLIPDMTRFYTDFRLYLDLLR